jgi:hypothetical protein
MWTTSNSRVERLGLALAAIVGLGAGCGGGARTESAPDSPRPARDSAGLAQPAATGVPRSEDRPVQIRSARPVAVRGDSVLERLAGQAFLSRAPNPVAIDVITAEPLGDLYRNASPEIYLNGERPADTRAVPPNRLILFLPDARRLGRSVSVTVAWLGSEPRTRSQPVVLTEEQLRPFR